MKYDANKRLLFFDSLIEDYLDFNDDEKIIDLVDNLKEIASELNCYLEQCVKVVNEKISDLQDSLIEKGLCPECGGDLEYIADISRETYVPYGDTSVPLGTGYRTVCSSCGYEVED